MSLSKVIRHIAPAVGFLAAVPLIGLLPAATANAASHAPATTGAATSVQIQAAPQVPVNDTSEGAVSPTATITGAVVLKPRNNAALTSFIASVTDKNSPSFHQYLPNGSFDARFGPTSATISAVTSTLEGDGLSVTNVASDGLLVSFSGSARNVESAFHTGLNTYKLANGSMGQATTSAVDVPSAISSAVSSVVGLNDLVQEQATGIVRAPAASAGSHPSAKTTHFAHPAGSPTPCAVATTDAQGFGGLTDDQIANAYGAFGLYGAGDFGAGQSIAVYELEPFSQSDLSTFDTCYFGATEAGQMASRLTVNPVDGGQPPGQGSGESILDVDDVSALAPGANIDVYEAPNNTFGSLDEYSTIVNRDVDKIVTTSWGECEQDLQTAEPGFQQSENYIFEQAAAQGQSVFAAAGDTGDDSCNEFRPPAPAPGQNPLSVLDPASQPYVVGVGGTTIDDATQPPAEHEWNDGANWGAGGGGISQSWTMPSWQQDATVPGIVGPSSADYTQANKVEAAFGYKTGFCQGTVAGATAATSCRLLPDVSAQADEFTGAITIFSTEFGGPYDGWITIGGTSSATPIWAALLALVNASPTCTANPTTADGVGFVSPLLYEVASNPTTYAASFNDITSGNNDIYGLDNGLVFPTTPGYDLASGLGSPEVTGPGGTAGLAANLCGEAAAPSRPTVSGLSPVFVPTSGGSVLVTGTGFGTGSGDVAGITVGAAQIPASAITVNSPTQLTASFPAAATALAPGSPQDGSGPANVVVTTDSGASSGLSSAAVMQYVDEKSGSPVPSVTGVSPYGGTQAGGTPVTLYGSGFTGTPSVTFGGVAGTGVSVLSPFELTVTTPKYATQTCAPSVKGETPTTDICQTEVQVTNGNGSSAELPILKPYEGPTLPLDSGAVPVLPTGCACEESPAPTEFDYVPTPKITSVSTSAGPASYADEFGGTVITLTGSGFDPNTLDSLFFGTPQSEAGQDTSYLYVTGKEIQFEAPQLVATASVQPETLPVSVMSLGGLSNKAAITYAGIPTVSSVLTGAGRNGAADTGGTTVTITGSGFDQAVGPLEFADVDSPYSIGTQYTYTVNSDGSISAETVSQNPALVDVEVCSVSGCASSPPGDEFYLYPPGNPKVDSISPTSGPPGGGTLVAISGENLGCVTSVSFGTVAAETISNAQAILDCGATNLVNVTAPPGAADTTVPVTVTTVESNSTGSGPSVSQATFTYGTPPGFTADTPPANAVKGTAYSYTFTATGDPTPTFAVASGTLPPGLTLKGTSGVLSGKPTATGDFTFKVKATNGITPDVVSGIITITVTAAESNSTGSHPSVGQAIFTHGTPPGFTADTPPANAVKGTAYSDAFIATGDPAPTFAVAAGKLPSGLTLDRTSGVLSGRPTATGDFTFKVKATNGITPDVVSGIVTITVTTAESNSTGSHPSVGQAFSTYGTHPGFTADTPQANAVKGTAYSYAFMATGHPAPTFAVASGKLPSGLTLDRTSGVLSGKPTATGSFTFKVKATNRIAPTVVSGIITITVTAAP